MARILIIDDQCFIREIMREFLETQHHTIDEAESGKQAILQLRQNRYDAAFLDLKMADGNGMETLPTLLHIDPSLPVIIISGNNDVGAALQIMRLGAFDYLEKPLDLQQINTVLKQALAKKQLSQPIADKIATSKTKLKNLSSVTEIIGQSPALLVTLAQLEKSAPSEAPIWITGANGTGKELIARRAHEWSHRSGSIMLSINCAALPESLLDTALFGYKKNSFTDAKEDRPGLFEDAKGGTIFLDEITSLSQVAQTKLLRAIEYKVINRVGDTKDIPIDVRIVAATNKDMNKLIKEEKFLIDLFMRLNVIELHLPSLAERIDDIPALFAHYSALFAAQNKLSSPKTCSPEAMQIFMQANWPGNIRQLRNMIERLYIYCDGDISQEDVEKHCPSLLENLVS